MSRRGLGPGRIARPSACTSANLDVLCDGKERRAGLLDQYLASFGQGVDVGGVAVVNNRPTGRALYSRLRNRLPGHRVDFYTNDQQNEDDIDLLEPGITILNVQSIKGQEFDTVFIMEIGELLLQLDEVNTRKMYMLCARARDHLILMHEGNRLPRALLDQLPGTEILERP